MTIEKSPVTSLLPIYYLAQAECEDQRESKRSLRHVVFVIDSLSQINNNAPPPDILTHPASISWYTHKAMKRWVWSASKLRKSCGERDYSVRRKNLSPLISSLKRGTLLGGCVEVPSYDIREGGCSFGEESPDPQLVSQSIDYPLLDSTYLKNLSTEY